jgi:hypothetical protein
MNSETGISPTDRFALVRLSDGVILNPNAPWPRADGGALVGANPDLAYFKRVAAAPLGSDHRFSESSTWEIVPSSPAAPEGHPAGEYRQTIVATKLPAEDLKAQVETHFQSIVQQWFPSAANPAVLVEAASAIVLKGNNAALSETQEATLSVVVGVGDAIRLNRERQAELNAAIDADEDYDIEEGWTLPA